MGKNECGRVREKRGQPSLSIDLCRRRLICAAAARGALSWPDLDCRRCSRSPSAATFTRSSCSGPRCNGHHRSTLSSSAKVPPILVLAAKLVLIVNLRPIYAAAEGTL
ncbi:hypothetical protein E2562_028402 [Oryza meyeriana var. granulata]|uniref:Uncharacterized protein n=1 Tax=Oryza meyeriana var. granulata TaxID=110450 RepID=A0A6G1E2V9_9ORYZ|nr:hypothetical protein E2562_028402 [Oryza meyeriana var. granulata]